jgi:NADH dehydrogenase FAD-containing subunit
VIKGELKAIDKEKKVIKIKGLKEQVAFDKMLVAWGAYKKRLTKDYSNVFYLEDRYSHAKAHNEILKADKIVVLGATMDAF